MNHDGAQDYKVVLELVVEGLGLEGHHERVRTLCKLESSPGECKSIPRFLCSFGTACRLTSQNPIAKTGVFRCLCAPRRIIRQTNMSSRQ